MQPAIRVEGLAKRYILRHEGRARYVALRDVLGNALRFGRAAAGRGEEEELWALEGVCFDVAHGERLGIIGRNGAGKSTLLKVLSRITAPTRGRIEIEGRVASLLEVGTGFHPELTGRENIFLNGAILGMSRRELAAKLEEIVAFAEVERFLDTPVKRYSSGMYVRLAFSIAASLDPDILIVDEVLAVGDARFQKKCLGRMSERTSAGRTVLFVSHNLAAIRALTSRVVMLEAGRVTFDGPTEEGIARYVAASSEAMGSSIGEFAGRGAHTRIHGARLLGPEGTPVADVDPRTPVRIEVDLSTDGTEGLSVEGLLVDAARAPVGMFSMYHFHRESLPARAGRYVLTFALQPPPLASGRYGFDLTTSVVNVAWDHYVAGALAFDVHLSNPLGHPWDFRQADNFGCIALLCAEPVAVRSVAQGAAAQWQP